MIATMVEYITEKIKLVAVLVGSVVLLSAAALHYGMFDAYLSEQADPSRAQPIFVMVTIDSEQRQQGRSSAVHIGNGYFLASYHAVVEHVDVTLRSPADETLHEGKVLWISPTHDIAFVHAPSLAGALSYQLACEPLQIGQQLEFRGSPDGLEGLTTWGRVAGPPRSITRPAWQNVVPVDAVILPGMSGGSVMDQNGRLAGIVIGTYTMSTDMFASRSYTGISYIVPGETLCVLLNRV
jgi:S1-C subfamily serine protease